MVIYSKCPFCETLMVINTHSPRPDVDTVRKAFDELMDVHLLVHVEEMMGVTGGAKQ